MKLRTALNAVHDAHTEHHLHGRELDDAMVDLDNAVRDSALLVEAVLGEHREYHSFGAATCSHLPCRLANRA